jgi:hypothetical protein
MKSLTTSLFIAATILLTSCSNDVSKILKTEVDLSKAFDNFAQGCMSSVKETNPDLDFKNVFIVMQVGQFCGKLANSYSSEPKANPKIAAATACVRIMLSNGLPTNKQQEKFIVSTCEKIAKQVKDLKK